MGANLQIIGFGEKINTVEKARKDFDERAEQDRYENGHCYSGGIGMFGALRYIDAIFDSVDGFEQFLQNKGTNDGYLARVKVIRETNPLKNARAKRTEQYNAMQRAKWDKKAPSVIRTLTTRYEKAVAKYEAIYKAQADKSTKTRFVAGGWASE